MYKGVAVYDTHTAVLVVALTNVLVSRAPTTEDRRRISALLDAEIAAIAKCGGTVKEIADLAVKAATKKYRQSQGVASRTSQKREELRRAHSQSAQHQ
jgi:hypothetical protein